jgi:hypothetical protein
MELKVIEILRRLNKGVALFVGAGLLGFGPVYQWFKRTPA